MTRRSRVLAAVAVTAGLIGAPPALAQSEEPDCFGRPPTILGTEGDDVLVGTDGPDVISGLGGTTPSTAWTAMTSSVRSLSSTPRGTTLSTAAPATT